MLILLPPSETKAPHGSPGGAKRVRLDRLVAPRLTPARSRVLEAVMALSTGSPDTAAAGLRLPPRIATAALAANRSIATSPTLAALDRYAGVIYTAMDVSSLAPAVRQQADTSLLIFSGLFGVVRACDEIPDYRVPGCADVPGLGPLTPVWRTALREAMPTILGRRFAVDLRSTDYAAMWAPTGPLRNQVLPVRVLSARSTGAPRVISHFSKHGKGLLTRALLERVAHGGEVASVADVEQTAAALGWQAEVRRVVGGYPALDVIAPPSG